ncbi:MAG: amino acid adenylation domain-containing protein [Acidobacteriota bacterium]
MIAATEVFRLSESQRRLWLAEQGGTPLVSACAIDIAGAVSPRDLRGALLQLMQRHEVLRSRLVQRAGIKVPFHTIADEAVIDWREEGGRQAVEDLVAEELQHAFDFERGPLLRARWVATANHEAVLILAVPALFADGCSLRRLVQEALTLCSGAGETLEEAIPYLDYVSWQEEVIEEEGEDSVRGQAFWRRQEGLRPKPPNLPIELPATTPASNGAVVAADRASVPVPLEGSTRAGLLELAHQNDVGVADVLRAAWMLLLQRLTGRESCLVDEAFDGRDEELATAVGPITRWVPMVLRAEPETRFRAVCQRLARSRKELESWLIYLPASEIRERPESAAIGFEFHGWSELGEGHEMVASARQLHVAAAEPFAIKLLVTETSQQLELALRYDAARFHGSDIEHLAAQLNEVLLSAATNPEVRIGDLTLVGAAERARIEGFTSSERGASSDDCIHHRIEAQAEANPLATALVVDGESLTYRELDERANQLAHQLCRRGVGPDVPTVLYLERSLHLVVGMLAILKAGGAYVPIDTSQPKRRLAKMLSEVRTPIVVTQERLAENLPAETPAICVDRAEERIDGESTRRPQVDVGPGNLAYVIFTSGSTGLPKGVAVEHHQIVAYLDGVVSELGFESGWSYASVSTVAADLGNTSIFPALTLGGTLHLLSQEAASDPAALVDYFAEHRIDCLKIVPSHIESLGAVSRPGELMPVQRLVLGGEAFKVPLAGRLRDEAETCRVFNHYGPSETTVGVLTHRVEEAVDPRCGTVPLGRPIPNVATHLLDLRGRPVSAWEPGELFIGGATVSRGYYGRPAQTAERFVPDPFSRHGEGGRLYRTGDRARRLGDGRLEFLGRWDHQIKFHGFRVELGEIRFALNDHAEIRDSVVALRQDQGGDDVLVAYYVSRQKLALEELREHLAKRLGEEVLPNFFVHLPKLPLTLNGKVNDRALPSVEEIRKEARRVFVAPRNDTETGIANIWAEVLGLDRVSAEANFFELGGHSLLATRIISRVRKAFHVDMPVRAIFEIPTVAGLARWVAESAPEATGDTPRDAIAASSQSLEDELAELEGLSEQEASLALEEETVGASGGRMG